MKSIRHLSAIIKEHYQTNMEKAMASHSSTLSWKIPWTAEPGGLQFMGSLRVRQAERLHFHFSLSCIGEENGNPLQCSCLENPRDGRAWWVSIYGVAQSKTGLKWLSSSSIKQTVPRYCVISLPCTWAIVSGNSCCCCSVTKSCLIFGTPWTAACQTSLSLTIFQFVQVHIHWIGDAIQLSHPLKPSSLPSVFQSIRVFSKKSAVHIRWPKYWSFTFSVSPSNEYWGLVSFKIDYFDLLAFQETLKSFPQHHSLKASILWHSAFFVVQISHFYMTTGKTVTLTIQTFVSKVMSLLFNTLVGLSQLLVKK